MVSFSAIQRPGAFPADRFVEIEGVPVFVAHEATLSNGRRVSFGPDELRRIAENGNRRIAETGDYAVVTIGHTARKGEEKPEPEVVGFAGPFRLGRFAGKPAILADFHIFREYKDALRRYPRRSPEFRLAEDLGTVHLDPIALLGADPPRLDMGLTLLYQERDEGALVEHYAAVMPAAANTFVPDEEYAMNDEQLKSILEAIEATDWVQWIKKKMAEEAAAAGAAKPTEGADAGDAAGQQAQYGCHGRTQQNADDGLRERYRMLEARLETQKTELEALRRSLDEERATRTNAERYSQLVQLRQVYAFDLDKEVQRCLASKMTDAQFREHLEVVRENYQRIPVGERLPPLAAALGDADEPREKYTADQRRRAREVVLQARQAGRELSFEEALEQVHANGRK